MKTMLPLITVAVVALSLSCGGSADFPPTQTPLQWPDSKLVELTTDFRPTEFVGDGTAGIGRNGEVYLLNLSSREHRQVTNDRHPKIEAVISGDYVAWTDERRKIRLPGRNGTGRQYSTDIFLRNLTTGEERRITDVPAKRKGLRFSGSRLVWQDNRNELHERYSDFDVFAYDLKTGREIPIAVAPGAQIGPAIFKETVVWADNRNSPTMGSPKAGCDRCPHNTFDIYAYDFTTGEKTLLAHTGSYRGRPDIYGRHVVWHGFGEDREPYIKLLDLNTGRVRTLAGVENGAEFPKVSDDFVVWTAGEPCDAGSDPPTQIQTGVFVYNLRTDEVQQISSYREPQVLLHQNVALVIERCHFPLRTYAVILD